MPHPKSFLALTLAEEASDSEAFWSSIKSAFEAHGKFNSCQSWLVYEQAAALMGRNRMTHLLLEVLLTNRLFSYR